MFPARGLAGEDAFRWTLTNLCALGSVEEIVYGRLLDWLGSIIAVVGDQQVSISK